MTLNAQKQKAALEAVSLIHTDMVVGLGTGSTAAYFVDGLAKRVALEGLKLICVPTSLQTRLQAEKLGLNLVAQNDVPQIDVTVDGADEIGPNLSLVKGGGGALLREKIVAYHSHKLVIIADHTKHVTQLGKFPLPVEIISFGADATIRAICQMLERHNATKAVQIRNGVNNEVFKTDNENLILDMSLHSIANPQQLADELKHIPGVVEHGLFLNLAKMAIIAHEAILEKIIL